MQKYSCNVRLNWIQNRWDRSGQAWKLKGRKEIKRCGWKKDSVSWNVHFSLLYFPLILSQPAFPIPVSKPPRVANDNCILTVMTPFQSHSYWFCIACLIRRFCYTLPYFQTSMKTLMIITNRTGDNCRKQSCTARVCNPHVASLSRPAKFYYAARGHICKLCTYYKNYTIIKAVNYTTYCYFSACGQRNSPQ